MDLNLRGSFRLFRAFGVDVYLHWTWFLIAFWQISSARGPAQEYAAGAWKVAEYVSLFAVVLLHEFGHALACRSVGGQADTIVLWPLGGIAYVAPPPRPGAVLWSIAAGPLVNVALILPTFGLWHLAAGLGWYDARPDAYLFLRNLSIMNVVLLVFNLLPVYPLDGGQIVQALLWFGIGRWESLQLVSLLGLILGGLAFAACVFLFGLTGSNPGAAGAALMLGLMAAFIALRSFVSFQQARAILALHALPRHEEAACPACATSPPRGPFWVCEHCQTRFDLFDHKGQCPGCGAWYLRPACPHCGQAGHIDDWLRRRGVSALPDLNSERGPEA